MTVTVFVVIELQFCIVMMQQNMQTGKEQDKRREHLSTKWQITSMLGC